MRTERAGSDFWRPAPHSKWNYRLSFLADALGIVLGSFTLAGITWTLASTNDGRIKALLWWTFGITAVVGLIVYRLLKREHRETRFGRALSTTHSAHHRLRDAAYARFIMRQPEATWAPVIETALADFATSFSIATGSDCHVAVAQVVAADMVPPTLAHDFNHYQVLVKYRSSPRSPVRSVPDSENTVGRNTDFRELFRTDRNMPCWHNNDLLQETLYDNTHWPEKRTKSTVPYRATMVWPIRKVLVTGTASQRQQVYMYGFLTVDSPDPHVFEYKRHFHLGAAFADHLVSVLWDPAHLRTLHDQTSRAIT